jgi:(E)-4-hydroxy-3-methylbut-2-enyl-diphosphate synthase
VNIQRRKTREINLGGVKIGGDNPIVVQSMTSTKTHNVEETLNQIYRLYEAGCELVRVAVPTEKDVEALEEIVKKSSVPIIADIHFKAELALKSMEKGVIGILKEESCYILKIILSV